MNNKSILLLGGDERQKELYYILKKEFREEKMPTKFQVYLFHYC